MRHFINVWLLMLKITSSPLRVAITHDGAAITADEDISPSCDRLLMYLSLLLIDARLAYLAYVSLVYAHDLMSKSLKDIQLQICHSMDSLL